jgi:hypothetical protein
MWIWRRLAAASLVTCAACVELPDSAEASGSGVSTGLQIQSVHCGSDATLDRYLAGAGSARIEILDGAHHSIYRDESGVTGEVDDSRDVAGVPGLWMLSVNPAGFAGQFKITLQCHDWVVDAEPAEPPAGSPSSPARAIDRGSNGAPAARRQPGQLSDDRPGTGQDRTRRVVRRWAGGGDAG